MENIHFAVDHPCSSHRKQLFQCICIRKPFRSLKVRPFRWVAACLEPAEFLRGVCCREGSLVDDDFIQKTLLKLFPPNVLFNRVRADQPVNVHVSSLSNAVATAKRSQDSDNALYKQQQFPGTASAALRRRFILLGRIS